MKLTAKRFSISALVVVLVICMTSLLFINIRAKASGNVTVSGTNVFTATGEANVLADKQTRTVEGDDGEEEEDVYYTMFALGFDDDAISYRRNLAYNWFARESWTVEEENEDGETVETVEYGEVYEGFFNMEIGFKNTAFERFIIRFESQQYTKTKDAKSQNYVIFYPHAEEGKVYATITSDEDAELDTDKAGVMDTDHIIIKFTAKYADNFTGGYEVYVGNGDDVNYVEGRFENVGGTYAKSSTSTTTPVYPLLFKAEFDEDAQGDDREAAKMVLYNLNGQSFELSGVTYSSTGDYYYGGTATDNMPPVLCLDNEINFFTVGGAVDVDYAVIDVLRTSPKGQVYFYVLTYDQYKDGDIDFEDRELFTEITSTNEYLLEPDKDKYYPSDADLAGTAFARTGEDADEVDKKADLNADMLVKVYFSLTDITSNSETDFVYLDWYLGDGYKVNVNGSDFIAVGEDKLGATYNYDGADDKSWEELIEEYQAEIDEAAKNLSAGSSSYLYLPSVESLFADNGTAYTDMKFSVYYYGASQLSNTGLSYNNLSINITKDGYYEFTVYATDAAGNNMYYLKDGEVVEFAASEIWTMFEDEDEEGLADLLPWFHFNVSYTGVEFEKEPGMQETAYVGTNYTASSFSINGISGYTVKYRLFLFDRAAYYADHGTSLTYSEFLGLMDELFDNADTRVYFTEILKSSGLEEGSEDYEKYAAYEWNDTSLSFIPQDNNAFYMIRAEVSDSGFVSDNKTCNLGIVASAQAKSLKGESDWLKNNITSVVLLCIAGLAFVGIILLLVIKPKNKEDLDEKFEASRTKKKHPKK